MDEIFESPLLEVQEYWLYVWRQNGQYPKKTERSGKWMLFISLSEIDVAWQKIKIAVEQGMLGDSAKVATSRPNPRTLNPNERLICVYTFDADDEKDVWRVREALKQLGFHQPLSYKMDITTLRGQYSTNGHRVSRYRG